MKKVLGICIVILPLVGLAVVGAREIGVIPMLQIIGMTGVIGAAFLIWVYGFYLLGG